MWNYNYDYLCHHGIQGQKWGIRRFQNADGSLTSAGKERYSRGNKEETRLPAKKAIHDSKFLNSKISDTELTKTIMGDVRTPKRLEYYDKKEAEEVKKAAKVGIKALSKMNGTEYDQNDINGWLTSEDTFGYPIIADLVVNKGYTSRDINQLCEIIDAINLGGDPDFNALGKGAQYNFNSLLYNGPDRSEAFAKICEEFKNGGK